MRNETYDPFENSDQLERLFNNFEFNWRPFWRLDDIVKMCREQPKRLHQFIGVEFAVIDLCRRWQEWSRRIEHHHESILEINSIQSTIPTWRDYQRKFGLNSRSTHILRTWEYISRIEFGDCPAASDYREIDEEVLQGRSLPSVNIDLPPHEDHKFQFRGKLMLGRQAKGDPTPFGTRQLDESQKLVVVAKSETTISRRQVEISMVANQIARIKNPSENRAIGVMSPDSHKKQHVLSPGGLIYLKLPVHINMGINISIIRRCG